MNAAVLADGHAAGGREGAQAALRDFWRRVSDAARLSPFRRSPLDVMLGRWTMDTSPVFLAFDLAARLFSPYDLNPMGGNPLREILADSVDFGASPIADPAVRHRDQRAHRPRPRVPQCRAHAGRAARVRLPADAVPGGRDRRRAYWDGGYAGNPTITPLVRECSSSDTVLVQVNPVERAGTPRSARDILNRLNEVSFNATLLKELRMIAVLRQVANAGNCEGARWASMRIHRIASEAMNDLGYSSKLNAEWDFLCLLRDEGRRCAEDFLDAHDAGHRPSIVVRP